MTTNIGVIIALLLVLIVALYITTAENFATSETGLPDPENVTHATSGVPGVSEGVAGATLSSFTGNWIYKSEDCLRQEVMLVDIVDSLLKITRVLTIRNWYPPVFDNEPSIVVPAEKFIIEPPLYRIIVLSSNELSLRSSDPFYAELPHSMKLDPINGILTYKGKRYVSIMTYKTSAKKLFPNCPSLLSK